MRWRPMLGALTAALLLSLGGWAPVGAQEPQRRGLVGEVVSLVEGSLTLRTPAGEEVSLSLTEGVVVKAPGRAVQGLAALAEGAEVGVLARVRPDGSLVALRLLVKPDRPLHRHISGAVVKREVVEGRRVITLVDATGREHQITLPQEAAIPPVGEVLTAVVVEEGPAAARRARGLVRAVAVLERLQKHARKFQERARSGRLDASEAESALDRVLGLLQANEDRLMAVLQGVRERIADLVPEEAGAALTAIDRAMAESARGFEVVRQAIDRAKREVQRLRPFPVEPRKPQPLPTKEPSRPTLKPTPTPPVPALPGEKPLPPAGPPGRRP